MVDKIQFLRKSRRLQHEKAKATLDNNVNVETKSEKSESGECFFCGEQTCNSCQFCDNIFFCNQVGWGGPYFCCQLGWDWLYICSHVGWDILLICIQEGWDRLHICSQVYWDRLYICSQVRWDILYICSQVYWDIVYICSQVYWDILYICIQVGWDRLHNSSQVGWDNLYICNCKYEIAMDCTFVNWHKLDLRQVYICSQQVYIISSLRLGEGCHDSLYIHDISKCKIDRSR